MRIAPLVDNPLNGITPNFGVFGVIFTHWWSTLFAGIWGLAIVGAAAFLLLGILSISAATNASNPNELALARRKTIWAGIALGALAALGVIVGALLAVTG